MTALLITFLVLLVLGAPIVFVIGVSMFTYFVATDQLQFLLVVPQRMFAGVDQFVLLAIPLFILAGNLMEVGGLTTRLLNFANVLVGRFRGGVSLTAIWSSLLCGGVSGSAAADAAALGSVLIPEMKRQGYETSYAAALMSMSSIMAPLIPPSIAMVIFGALSSTSIARLFVGGIVPGFLLAIGLTAYASWVARRRNYPRFPAPTVGAFVKASVEVLPVLILPLIIVVGIRGGVFTPTEAAAVAVMYALIAAGVFQLSPLKATCLAHCRSPAEFLSRHWRAGRLGAFRLGILHGAYCLGCCWALMLLLFAAGIMNLVWIAGLAVLVLIEKLAPFGARLSPAIAAALIAAGLYVAVT